MEPSTKDEGSTSPLFVPQDEADDSTVITGEERIDDLACRLEEELRDIDATSMQLINVETGLQTLSGGTLAQQDEEDIDFEDSVAPYLADKEPMPPSPIYHPAFSVLRRGVERLIELLEHPLETNRYRDPNVHGMVKELEDRREPRSLEPVRIALVGDMATGKSSLLNSILGVGMIARRVSHYSMHYENSPTHSDEQGDTGNSCTWVVHEYQKYLPKQTQAFAAEVTYFDQLERAQIIRELFSEYYESVVRTKEMSIEREDSVGQETIDERIDRENILSSNLEIFRALFCDKSEFATDESAEEFLRSAKSKDDDNVVSELILWADALVMKHCGSNATTFVQASTTQTLLYELQTYSVAIMGSDGNEAVSPWPMVKSIRFGLNNALLNQDVMLVDLPGLQDADRVRNKSVAKAAKRCTHYMIVARISRVEDDQTVQRYMKQGYLSRCNGRVTVVCTHTDMIDKDSRPRDCRPRDIEHLNALQTDVAEIEDERSRTSKRLKSARGQERNECYEQMDHLEEALVDAKNKETSFRVHLRNEKVTTALQKKYLALTTDQTPLHVFCVSNSAYATHQEGHLKRDRPSLSVRDTNLPKLRRYLKLAPAIGKFNDIRFLVDTQFPVLLTIFELWCGKAHMKRRKELEEIVKEPFVALPPIIEGLMDKLRVLIETRILLVIKQKEEVWRQASAKLSQTWCRDYKSGFLAFLRRKGMRAGTKAKEEVSWNRQLIRIMAPDLKSAFDELHDFCVEQEPEILRDLMALVDTMREKIEGKLMTIILLLAY